MRREKKNKETKKKKRGLWNGAGANVSVGGMVAGVGVRLGRPDEEVRGGAGAHVVAGHPRAGLSLPVCFLAIYLIALSLRSSGFSTTLLTVWHSVNIVDSLFFMPP